MRITVCASMTFSLEIVEIARQLKERGHEVDLPKFTEHYSTLSSREEMHVESAQNKIEHDLIRYYYRLIEKSDAILVVNKTKKGIENYIGANTLLEMGFAYVLNKRIYLLNPIPKQDSTDEIIAMRPLILLGKLESIV